MSCPKKTLKSLFRPLPTNILPAYFYIFFYIYLNVHGKRKQFYLQTQETSLKILFSLCFKKGILNHSPVCHQWSKTGTLKTLFDHSSVSTSQCSPATNIVLNL